MTRMQQPLLLLILLLWATDAESLNPADSLARRDLVAEGGGGGGAREEKPEEDDWPSIDGGDIGPKDYRGHALLRVTPQDEYHLKMLASLADKTEVNGVDFWQMPTVVKKDVDILVPPQNKDYLRSLMVANGIQFSVVTDDLQSLMDEERNARSVSYATDQQPPPMTEGGGGGGDGEEQASAGAPPPPPPPSNPDSFNLTSYHTYEEIMSYLDHLSDTCNSTCATQVIGKSYEGRDLKLIKIGRMSDETLPGFWIDAGIHAREWISPASALFFITKLLDPADSTGRFLASRYRWFILPLSNPDGYEYTWTTDRLWRKNRSRHPDPRVKCRGVDPNRNWDFHWGERGTSDKPCLENYSGWQPFSELETKAMADYILSVSKTLAVYISLHSYGQYLLTPWGYTTKLPTDFNDLVSLGEMAAEAMRKPYGKRYMVGSAARLLYLASGGSDDWAKGVAGIKYSYTIELRDNGKHGFILPASMIEETSAELLNAIRALAAGVIRKRNANLRRLMKKT